MTRAAWPQETDEVQPAALLDDLGDPLPNGAIARLGTLRLHHGGELVSLAVSPDSKTVVSGATHSSAIAWEAQTGKQIFRIDKVGYFVDISPDGKLLATAGERQDTRIRIWDLRSGAFIRQIEVKGTEGAPVEGIGPIAFLRDRQALAVETWWEDARGMPEYPRYRKLRVLQLDSGNQVNSFSAPDDIGRSDTSFSFSPDGKFLAAIGGKERTVYLLDASTYKVIDKLGTIALACTWSADAQTIAVAHPKEIRLIDTRTRKDIRSFTGFPGHYGSGAGPIALSPDGKLLAAGGGYGDPQVRLWSTETGELVPFAQRHWRGTASDLKFTPDGKRLVCASGSRVRIWDVDNGAENVLGNTPRGELTWAKFSPDGKILAVCEGVRGIRLHDAGTRRLLRQFGQGEYIRSVTFSPDGKTLATAGNALRLWSTASGKNIRTLQAGPDVVDRAKLGLSCAEFLPDGIHLVSGGFAGIIRIWNIASGDKVRQIQQPINNDHHLDPVRGAAVSPDGTRMATIAGNVYVWNLDTGELLATLDGRNQYSDAGRPIAFSPDGELLAFETHQYSNARPMAKGVLIQNVKEVKDSRFLDDPPDQRGTSWKVSVAFSPDGRLLATGGGDMSVRLWNVATGKELQRFEGHIDLVSFVDFSPDGKTLASASSDGTVLFWDVSAVK